MPSAVAVCNSSDGASLLSSQNLGRHRIIKEAMAVLKYLTSGSHILGLQK